MANELCITRRAVCTAFGATLLIPGCATMGAASLGDRAMKGADMTYDAVIVGGGPAGLSAALTLGRARKGVLLCDSGPRRNAAAVHMHNFVTRDGTPPEDFRRIGREQLAAYPGVEVRDARVERISGTRGDFTVVVGADIVKARRLVLCTGLIDEPLPFDGAQALWGQSIFQCPFCHGWEVRERPWGFLSPGPEGAHFAVMLRGWTREVTVFTNGAFEFTADQDALLRASGVAVERRPIARLDVQAAALTGVVLEGGARVPCEVLLAHPPQRQVELVKSLNLEIDAEGLVRADPMTRATSMPGVYAAGDLTTRLQAAIAAAAMGMQAAAMLNHELTAELALAGAL